MDENVEYEEREDEFDIVSDRSFIITPTQYLISYSYPLGRRTGTPRKKNES